MKTIAITFILGAMLASPAISMISTGGVSKDIIVTVKDINIDSKDQAKGTAIITLKNPSIDFKVQHGKAKSESLTTNRLVGLWSTQSGLSDSFATNPPNAKLTFWDQNKDNYYESDFIIENVKSVGNSLQMKVKFLKPTQPMMSTPIALHSATAGQPGRNIVPIAQFKQLFSGVKTSAVLTIDNSPFDPRD